MPGEAFGKVLDRRSASESTTTTSTDHGTKSEFLKHPQHEKIPSFPGDFELRKLVLKFANRFPPVKALITQHLTESKKSNLIPF